MLAEDWIKQWYKQWFLEGALAAMMFEGTKALKSFEHALFICIPNGF